MLYCWRYCGLVSSSYHPMVFERPQPQPSVLAGKYPRLKEIDGRLTEQNGAIFEREKQRDRLKKDLAECNAFGKCMGIFKGGRRKELQQEIDGIEMQISNMLKKGQADMLACPFDPKTQSESQRLSDLKKRLSSIVKEYRFDSVQAFYKELNAAKKEHFAYKAACAEWEKAYGEKVVDSTSIKERLRQKGKIVKEREAGRAHQERQKDKGAR